MAFSSAEVEEAVEKLVRAEVRTHYGALGNRRTDLTFNDVKNAAAGVFLTHVNAPFYVVRLASDRLQELVATERDLITNFIALVKASARKVKGVSSLSALNNAQVALNALSSAVSSRTSTVATLASLPAWQRFELNTSRFLDETRGSLVSRGEVVDTPQTAREGLGTSFSALFAAHQAVLARTELLENAITNFNELDLATTLSTDILGNAGLVLEGNITALRGLTESQRLGILRAVTLDILAARSTIRGLTSLNAPSEFLILEGEGAPYADSTHLVTPATLSSTKYGPYTLINDSSAGLFLDFILDGDSGVTTTIQLPASAPARFPGVIQGPYDTSVTGAVSGLTSNVFRIQILNWPDVGDLPYFDITLSTAALEAYEVAEEINTALQAALPGVIIQADYYANPLKYAGSAATVDVAAPTEVTFYAPVGIDFTNLDGLGTVAVKEGDQIRIRDTSSVNDGLVGEVRVGGVFADRLECDLLYSPGSGADEANKAIEVASGNLTLRFRVPLGADEVTAVDQRVSFRFPQFGPDGEDRQRETLNVLGFVPLMEVRSRGNTAQDLATYITQNFAASVAGVPRLTATAVYEPTLFEGSVRTDPSNFLKAVLYNVATTASVAYSSPTNTFTFAGDLTALINVGDIVVIRDGSSDPNEIGSWGVIDTVSDTGGNTQVTADMSEPIDSTSSCSIEIGPDARTFPFDPTLRVATLSNTGDYGVLSVGDIPTELNLDTPLPNAVGGGNQPVELEATVGQFRLDFASTNTTLSSKIVVDTINFPATANNARQQFFTDAVNEAVGTTPFFLLPEWPAGIGENDILELYPTQYNAPTVVLNIEGLEPSLRVITLEEGMDVDVGSFPFNPSNGVPFARIRKYQMNNYFQFRENLQAFHDLSSSDATPFFNELRRRLNSLLVNTNPTASQVNDVVTYALQLEDHLTQLEGYLAGYDADPVEPVDTLVDTYVQKGADRAVALLLRADFQGFFGLDVDEVSYTGTLKKALSTVERNDLPIRKTNRLNNNAALDALLSSYEEPDFEFDQSDIDDLPDPAIPAGRQY